MNSERKNNIYFLITAPPAILLAAYYFWQWFVATDAAALRVFVELMRPILSRDGLAVAAANAGRVALGAGAAIFLDLTLTAVGLKLLRAGCRAATLIAAANSGGQKPGTGTAKDTLPVPGFDRLEACPTKDNVVCSGGTGFQPVGAEEICLANALGLGAGALLIFFAGLAGVLKTSVVLAALCLATILCIKEIFHIARFTVGAIPRFLFGRGKSEKSDAARDGVGALQQNSNNKEVFCRAPPPSRAATNCFKIILLLYLCLSFFAAVAPPTEPDTLWYHLALPKIYIKSGGIVPTPHILPSHWPLNAEMLFTAAMLLGRDTAAQALNWLLGVHLLIAIGCLYRQWRGTERWGAGAAALFATIPLVVWEFANTYSDLAVTYFKIAAVLCVFVWRKNNGQPTTNNYQLSTINYNSSLLTVCGVLCGLAMGTKINGALGVLLVWTFIFFDGGASTLKTKLSAALRIGLIAAAVAAPWHLRTYMLTGNPVFPFFHSTFGGAHWNALAARDYLAYLRGYIVGDASFENLLVLPYKLMFLKFRGALYWPDTVGALLFAALIIFPAFRREKQRGLWVGIAVYAAAWFLISQQFRHLMPALALLAIQLAVVFEGTDRKILRVGAAAVMLLQLALVAVWLSARLPAAAGPLPKETYLGGALEDYDAVRFINTRLPPTAKILLLWGNSGYYLERDYILGDPRWQGYVDYSEYKTAEELNAALRDMGITHILFINANLKGVEELDKWTRRRLKLPPGAPTAVSGLLRLQNECISRGLWKPVYFSPMNRAVVLKIK